MNKQLSKIDYKSTKDREIIPVDTKKIEKTKKIRKQKTIASEYSKKKLNKKLWRRDQTWKKWSSLRESYELQSDRLNDRPTIFIRLYIVAFMFFFIWTLVTSNADWMVTSPIISSYVIRRYRHLTASRHHYLPSLLLPPFSSHPISTAASTFFRHLLIETWRILQTSGIYSPCSSSNFLVKVEFTRRRFFTIFLLKFEESQRILQNPPGVQIELQ